MRIALIVLQVAGGLSILPYPFVLVANVMSIAAEGPRDLNRLLHAIPFVLLSLYPLAWFLLFRWSWHALDRGAIALAFALSAIPLAFSLAALVWLTRR